jgi:hypothetical protein
MEQKKVVEMLKSILATAGFTLTGTGQWTSGDVTANICYFSDAGFYKIRLSAGDKLAWTPDFGMSKPNGTPRFGQKMWMKGQLRKARREISENNPC